MVAGNKLRNVECSDELRGGRNLANPPPGEEVCISGLSGVFPESSNVYELRDNLMNKVDMVTSDDRRWILEDHPDLPTRMGKVKDITRFDTAFFGISPRQCDLADPGFRIMLEKCFEAIMDAGVNPTELQGANVGVFVAMCTNDGTCQTSVIDSSGASPIGFTRPHLASRLAYELRVNGPVCVYDTACSSTLFALDQAYQAVRHGLCEQALVTGTQLNISVLVTQQFVQLGVLSPDGRCKTFDEKANGYVRAECVGAIFIQKGRDAKRIYATVVHSKTNCDGYKERGITFPSGQLQQQLLEDFYDECQVDPTTIAWVEAHGTGTAVGDPEECHALDVVFCNGRVGPLPVGSVKSNIGHSEGSAAIGSIAKTIIAMETGIIPPNLNFEQMKSSIPGLTSGRMKVVTELQPWDGGYVAMNSFGFGGANAHVLLKSNPKNKICGGAPVDKIPRLVTVSSRTKQGVNQVLDDIESRPIDAEHVRLLHDLYSSETPGHRFRGFSILKGNSAIRDVQYCDSLSRPVWFILSGLNAAWSGMSKSLLALPVFARSIDKCHQVLKPLGVDLMRIIADENPKTVTTSYVAITALQIGLVDIMKTIGVLPHGLIGHSIGELAAAYADNCLTVEQTILASYYWGLALMQGGSIEGAMAQIDIGNDAVRQFIPQGIEVACHHSATDCVISGPVKEVAAFVHSLRSKGVKTSDVRSHGIAAQSRYVKNCGTELVKYLQKVIPSPKYRSKRWVSSSLSETQWESQVGKLASPEYFANSLSSPVLLEEALRHIPRHAVLVELSPTAALQGILNKVARHTSNISFGNSDVDGIDHLLSSIGKLYETGVAVDVATLYPDIEYPVSRGTPMISPLIGWDHSAKWLTFGTEEDSSDFSGERDFNINVQEGDYAFYSGHVIDGRNLFPATGYLILALITYKDMYPVLPSDNIVFENVKFHRATNLPSEGSLNLSVSIQRAMGNFEVSEGGVTVVSGRISAPKTIDFVPLETLKQRRTQSSSTELSTRDVYKELRLRGYNYSGLFRSIVSAESNGESGKIRWHDNFVAFMDNMLQMQILHEDTRGLFVPTSIDRLSIEYYSQLQHVMDMLEKNLDPVFDVTYNSDVGVLRSGFIEIRGLKASAIVRRKMLGEPVVEKFQFLPNQIGTLNVQEALRACVHIGLENQSTIKVKAVEVVDAETNPDKKLLSPIMADILGDLPLIQAELVVLSEPNNPLVEDLTDNIRVADEELSTETDCLFVLATNLLTRTEELAIALNCITATGYLLTREHISLDTSALKDLEVMAEYCVEDEKLVLVKKVVPLSSPKVVRITEKDYSWIPELQVALRDEKSTQRIILFAQREPLNGILGLFNCIRKEPGGMNARCFFILDDRAPEFDSTLPFYKTQIAKDIALNVYKDGQWGSYRHLRLEDNPTTNVPHAFANITSRGDLSSLRWLEGPIDPKRTKLDSNMELVNVYYSALNFRDVMVATGKLAAEVVAKGRLQQECVQGLEFAGRDAKGHRVMGMVVSGAMSTLVAADKYMLWDVPDEWSLEDAATVPVVYSTALFALKVSGRMRKGESVLIHAGSGGVGQAAINIALHEGLTVFTTVGTQEKRDFIKQRFPQLRDNHIGNSRDTSFEQMILQQTNGRGVDLVLNSLAEEKLQASVRCLATGGRFLEIGKFDLANDNLLGLEVFLRETSFHGVMLDNFFAGGGDRKKALHAVLSDGIKSGAVRPLTRTVFPSEEVEAAFRYMGAGKHIGKVLLQIRPDDCKTVAVPETILKKASPKFFCDSNYTYVITGGLGGFGLELADWLVLRGARKVVLSSRTGLKSGYQKSRVAVWQSYGATVHVATSDISTAQGVTELLKDAQRIGPVAAIFHLAVVLADALFDNQTEESFIKSAAPKAEATKHLDAISRRLCPQLQHFVTFSSVSCGRGNAGQTNYGMSNSVMERVCERRVADGLPGLAVQWGAVGEVGLVAEMQEDQHEIVIGGTLQQRIGSCLHILDGMLRQPHPVVASMVVAEKKAGSGGATNIVDCVANILCITDRKSLSIQTTLSDLGMDSVTAVEIKQTLEREFGVFLTPQEIRKLTFNRLIEIQEAGEAAAATSADEGLNAEVFEFMIRSIGDEASSSKPFVTLPSLDNGTNSTLPTLFLVPGIEGMASSLLPLCANLNSTTIGLQLGFKRNVSDQTASEMAQSLLPHMLQSLASNAPFYLIGYSFGGAVALHMTLLLEKLGHKGKLYIIDGAPAFLQSLTLPLISKNGTEDDLQISLLIYLTNQLKKQPTHVIESIREEMLKLETWDKRVDYFLTLVPESESAYSLEYRRSLVNGILRRTRSIINFSWPESERVQSDVTLFRPTYSFLKIAPDYDLSKYCSQQVDVHLFENVDHVNILELPNLATIINETAVIS